MQGLGYRGYYPSSIMKTVGAAIKEDTKHLSPTVQVIMNSLLLLPILFNNTYNDFTYLSAFIILQTENYSINTLTLWLLPLFYQHLQYAEQSWCYTLNSRWISSFILQEVIYNSCSVWPGVIILLNAVQMDVATWFWAAGPKLPSSTIHIEIWTRLTTIY